MIENVPLMTGPNEADDDFNLTVIRTDESILLGRKINGFGAGQLVLPGGKTRYYFDGPHTVLRPFHIEAVREVKEETGLIIPDTQFAQMGTLHIADKDDIKTIRIYEAKMDSAPTTKSTELTDLQWHDSEEIPYEEMPKDYTLWLPHVLAGYAVSAFIESNLGQIVEAKIFRQKLIPLGRMEEATVGLI